MRAARRPPPRAALRCFTGSSRGSLLPSPGGRPPGGDRTCRSNLAFPTSARSPDGVAQPNLLLVVVDDLRFDRLAPAPAARAETPFLSELTERGVRHTHCWSPCGWTLPACASLLTGRLPSEHGLVHHEHRFQAPKIPALLGHGWATLGIGNNGNLVPDDIPKETLDALGFERRPEVWKHFGWQEGFEAYRWFHKHEKDAPFEAFDEWLGSRGDDGRPWFAMLHTNLVHDYDEERPWTVDVERFLGGPVPPVLRSFRDGPFVFREPPNGLTTDQVRRALLAKYDGGIEEFDRRLAAALAPIDWSTTVVVLASDHGEGFDADRERVHHCGRLHDDLLRVPLLVVYPPSVDGAPPPGSEVTAPCSLIDVAPTLLGIGGADEAAAALPGHDLRRLPAAREIHAEDFGYLYLPPGDAGDRMRRYEYKRYDLASRATIAWPRKTIESRIGRQSWREEYDLALDPGEHVNRASGAQRPLRRPEREEGGLAAAVRARTNSGEETDLLGFSEQWPRFVRKTRSRRKLMPLEKHRTYDEIPIDEREPITFIVAVADADELRRHVLVSECFQHGGHQWLFVENGGNRAYSSISRLYNDASKRARHDLRFHVHQDVFFPPDWEDRLFRALAELEARDPHWGVVGAAGRAPATGDGSEPPNIGHWSDPHKYHKPPKTGLPAEVQILDELWLGFRASRGLEFDPGVPGFHCYGADLCMAARDRGLRSYVIDAPVVHKLVLPDGTLIERSVRSAKIEERDTDAFRSDFQRTADHVAKKWAKYLPFQSTCHVYPDPTVREGD